MNKNNNNKKTNPWEHLVTEYAVLNTETSELVGSFATMKEVKEFKQEKPYKTTIYKIKTFKLK